jgi:hypothetical protein
VAAEQLAASGWADGCPVAAIALETASRSEQLADACASVFRSWRDALADAFENRGVKRSDADVLAALVLSGPKARFFWPAPSATEHRCSPSATSSRRSFASGCVEPRIATRGGLTV